MRVSCTRILSRNLYKFGPSSRIPSNPNNYDQEQIICSNFHRTISTKLNNPKAANNWIPI